MAYGAIPGHNLPLIGARRNEHYGTEIKVGPKNTGPGKAFLQGVGVDDVGRYHEEYIGRDFDRATISLTAHSAVNVTVEMFGRANGSDIKISLGTYQLAGENAKAFVYEGAWFEYIGFELKAADGPLEQVSWFEHQ